MTAALTPLPRRKGGPHTWARFIHAGAREGIVAHAEAILHHMLAVLFHMLAIAGVAGGVLTCIGAGIVGSLWFFGCRVHRSGPSPKTADVRVRRGQSYRQALVEERNRR